MALQYAALACSIVAVACAVGGFGWVVFAGVLGALVLSVVAFTRRGYDVRLNTVVLVLAAGAAAIDFVRSWPPFSG